VSGGVDQVHGDVLKHTGPSLRSELSEGDKSMCQCAAAGSIGDLSGGAERVEYGRARGIELHRIMSCPQAAFI
jgi:hypothetical protein